MLEKMVEIAPALADAYVTPQKGVESGALQQFRCLPGAVAGALGLAYGWLFKVAIRDFTYNMYNVYNLRYTHFICSRLKTRNDKGSKFESSPCNVFHQQSCCKLQPKLSKLPRRETEATSDLASFIQSQK